LLFLSRGKDYGAKKMMTMLTLVGGQLWDEPAVDKTGWGMKVGGTGPETRISPVQNECFVIFSGTSSNRGILN